MLTAALAPRICVAVISGALNVLQERLAQPYSRGAQIIPGLLQLSSAGVAHLDSRLRSCVDAFLRVLHLAPLFCRVIFQAQAREILLLLEGPKRLIELALHFERWVSAGVPIPVADPVHRAAGSVG